MTVHINDIEDIRQTPEQANIFWKKLQLSRDYKEMILKSIRAHETGCALNGKEAKKNIDDFTTEGGKDSYSYSTVRYQSRKVLMNLTSYRSSGSRENTHRRELGNIVGQAVSLLD